MPKNWSIDLTLQPRQLEFSQCNADEVLYGGSKGGGKTEALIKIAIRRAVNGGKVLLLRRTFPELEKSIIRRMMRILPKGYAEYYATSRTWFFPTGGVIQAGHCDNEDDVYKYDGDEYDMICIDELTHFSEFIFMNLLPSNRTSDARFGDRCWIRCTATPGKIGHAWVKRRYLSMPAGSVWKPVPSEEDPDTGSRCFIPARVTDNLILMKNNPGYLKRLNALPEKERKMLRDGDWNVFEGQFFPWESARHVVKPFAIPPGWRRYISVDWGYTAPFCALWFALSPDAHKYCYREIYATQLTDEEQAKQVLAASAGEHIYLSVAPGDCWYQARGKNRWGVTIAEAWAREGWYPVQSDSNSPGMRITGWQRCRKALEIAPDGLPWTMFFETCKNTVRTLPELVHDDHKVEDIDPHAEDHAADAWRQFELSRPEAEQTTGSGLILHTEDPASIAYWKARHKRVAEASAEPTWINLDESEQEEVTAFTPWE